MKKLIVVLCVLISCKKETVPTSLEIDMVDSVSRTTITCTFHIYRATELNGIKGGICWSQHTDPTIDDKYTNSNLALTGSSTSFTITAPDLTPGTIYYIRAWASDDDLTYYSPQVERWTFGDPVTDIDGNAYNTITIGTQMWMVENLKTTHYRNGDAIPNVLGQDDWPAADSGIYCFYDNSTANLAIYGNLYNWYAVQDARGLAPTGWHVPTDAEWDLLVNFLGGSDIAGYKMKKNDSQIWTTCGMYPDRSSNESGFTALAGGDRSLTYSWATFVDLNCGGMWWSSTEIDNSYAWPRSLWSAENSIGRPSYYNKRYGMSVRCVRD